MTPVQEVEFFLHRQEAHAAIEKRKSAVLKSVTVTYTTPAKAEAPTTASSAKKRVKTPPDYIVVHDSSSEEDARRWSFTTAPISCSPHYSYHYWCYTCERTSWCD